MKAARQEWELLPPGRKASIVFRHAAIACTVALGVTVASWIGASVLGRPFRLWDAMLSAALGLAIGSLYEGLRLARTIGRSRARMSDPMYVAKVIEQELGDRR